MYFANLFKNSSPQYFSSTWLNFSILILAFFFLYRNVSCPFSPSHNKIYFTWFLLCLAFLWSCVWFDNCSMFSCWMGSERIFKCFLQFPFGASPFRIQWSLSLQLWLVLLFSRRIISFVYCFRLNFVMDQLCSTATNLSHFSFVRLSVDWFIFSCLCTNC